MFTEEKEIARAFSAQLGDRIGWDRFELWFGGVRWQVGEQTLTVDLPSVFYRDWIRANFRDDLTAICELVAGCRLDIEYRIDETLAVKPSPPEDGARSESPQTKPTLRLRPPATTGSTTAKAGIRPENARHDVSLESFIVGEGNKLACTTANLVVESPGHVTPLLLHGGTGVGKTHLLEGMCEEVRRRHRGKSAVYLTSEQFTTLYLEALNGKGLPSFRRKYRGVDLLAIDDVQFFAGRRATLVELLYTIDTLMRDGKQLILAADRPPGELHDLGAELMARLSQGVVCRLESPDYETRLGIVSQWCDQRGLEFDRPVQQLLATHVTGCARQLSGALNRLRATQLASGEAVTTTVAEEALSELSAQNGRLVRLADIEQAVCNVFGLEPESLKSGRRSQSVAYPRMLAMFLARKHTRAALTEIGHYFGRRSHSTVISANKKVQHWMSDRQTLRLAQRDWHVDDAVRKVESELKSG